MVPQGAPPTTSGYPAQDARLLRYQDVLTKISSRRSSSNTSHTSTEGTPNISDGWISDGDEVEEDKCQGLIKSESIGPLLGGFADAQVVE